MFRIIFHKGGRLRAMAIRFPKWRLEFLLWVHTERNEP